MKKKSGKKTGVSDPADRAAGVAVHRAQRPWKLMLLGVAAFGLVLFIQLGGPLPVVKERAADKVYSAAAAQFEPMAVSSRQTGLVEPPGIAKPLRLFGVKVGSNSREGLAVLGAAESSSRTYVAGALLE